MLNYKQFQNELLKYFAFIRVRIILIILREFRITGSGTVREPRSHSLLKIYLTTNIKNLSQTLTRSTKVDDLKKLPPS